MWGWSPNHLRKNPGMDPSQIMLPSTGPLRYTANPEAEDFDLQDLPTGRGLLGCEDVAFHGKNDDNIKYYVEHIWKVGDGNSEIDCYFLKSSHVCFLHVFFCVCVLFYWWCDVGMSFSGSLWQELLVEIMDRWEECGLVPKEAGVFAWNVWKKLGRRNCPVVPRWVVKFNFDYSGFFWTFKFWSFAMLRKHMGENSC